MNTLYATLDAKLTALLSGKSPVIAQAANFPQFLLGKCFFNPNTTTVTPTGAIWSPQVPGYINAGGGTVEATGTDPVTGMPYAPGATLWTPLKAQSYDHAIFTSALTAVEALAAATPSTITWDETNHIATIPRQASTVYGGLPYNSPTSGTPAAQVGLFDWSMAAHYLLHQGSVDTKPVPYYVQEAGTWMPEKVYDYAVAEIIIEGPTALTIPDAYNKYNFFRIHNFNSATSTVAFGTNFTVTVGPFGVATVRRDRVAGTYKLGYNYFWKANGGKTLATGDPRFYWFQQTGLPTNYATTPCTTWALDGRASDTMAANNVLNPAILLDWIKYFTRTVDTAPFYGALTSMTIYAGFIKDQTVVSDESAHYAALYGNPAVTTTLLGDLLHHKGTIYAIQFSKTATDFLTGRPTVTVLKGSFNGYATITADMVALGISVTTNASGDLQLCNANPTEYDLLLIPIGTNFLKQGDANICHLALTGTTQYAIESAVFELDQTNSESGLTHTPNQIVFPPSVTTSLNQRTWYNWTVPPDETEGAVAPTANIETGSALTTMSTAARSTATPIHGIHSVTVAQLLTLKWWGDGSLASQANAHYALKASLKLTPQGLVLIWSEQYDGTQPPSTPWSQTYANWLLGKASLVVNHQILFRHHGWGYVSDIFGSQSSGMLSPRVNRYLATQSFTDDLHDKGSPGTDFTTQRPECTQSAVRVQTHISRQTGSFFNWGGGRFWQLRGGDMLDLYLSAVTGPAWNCSAATTNEDGSKTLTTDAGTITVPASWVDNRVGSLFSPTVPLTTPTPGSCDPFCMVLLPEMYNGIAQAINAASAGVPLDWRALRWNYLGQIIQLDPTTVPAGATTGIIGGETFPTTQAPIPVDAAFTFDSGSLFESFCRAMGIPVFTSSTLPIESSDMLTHRTTPCVMVDVAVVSTSDASIGLSGATYNSDGTSFVCTSPSITATMTVNISTELVPSAALARGEAAGSWCLGTFDPNDALPTFPAGSQPWSYYVASADMTRDTATALGWAADSTLWAKGDLLTSGGLNALFSNVTAGDAITPFGTTYNLTTSYTDFRWVRFEDVEAFLGKYGFTFNFVEVIVPLTLTYLEDQFMAEATVVRNTMTAGFGFGYLSGPTSQLSNAETYINSLGSTSGRIYLLNDGPNLYTPAGPGDGSIKPMGTILCWYTDVAPDQANPSAMNAKWKIRNLNDVSANNTFIAPLDICDVKCRATAPPFFRIVQASGSIGLNWVSMHDSFGPDPGMAGMGFSFIVPVDYATSGPDNPIVGSGFNWDMDNFTAITTSPSTSQIAFTTVVFSQPSGATDLSTPYVAMLRSPYQETDNHDSYEAYIIHTWGAQRQVTISMIGQPIWIKTMDCWNSNDAMFAIDGQCVFGAWYSPPCYFLPFTAIAD